MNDKVSWMGLPSLLTCVLLFTAAPAAGQARATTVALDDGDPAAREAAVDWLAERLRNAREGRPEIVRLPVALRSRGWGCPCPDAYIGVDPNGNIFSLGWLRLDVRGDAGGGLKESETGAVVVAEGWFTGAVSQEDLRSDPSEPEDFVYALDHLVVARTRPLRDGESAKLEVVLGHPATSEPVTPLRDDRPWFVVAGSAPLSAPNHAERAQKLADKVKRAGVEDVEIIDSRRTELLWCCADVVVAGRFATQEEAKERVKALRKHRLKSYEKKAFEPGSEAASWPERADPPASPASPEKPADVRPTVPSAAVRFAAVLFAVDEQASPDGSPRLVPLACVAGGAWKPGPECVGTLPSPVPVALTGGRTDAIPLLGAGDRPLGKATESDWNTTDLRWDYAVWPPERGASLFATAPAGAAGVAAGAPAVVLATDEDEKRALSFLRAEFGAGDRSFDKLVTVDVDADGRPERFASLVHTVDPEHHTEQFVLAYAHGRRPRRFETLVVGQPIQFAQVDAVTDLDGDGRRELVLGIRGECEGRLSVLVLRPDAVGFTRVHAVGGCTVE